MTKKETIVAILCALLSSGGAANSNTVKIAVNTEKLLATKLKGEDEDESTTNGDTDEDDTTDEDDSDDADEDSDAEGDEDSDADADDGEAEEEEETADEEEEPPAKPPKKGKGKDKPAKTPRAKKPQSYERENDTHREIYANVVSSVAPNWRKSAKTKALAKKVSIKLSGSDFLDADGEVLPAFKSAVKKGLAVK